MAGASSLAADFNHEKLMPLFQLSLIMFSSITRLTNARYFLKTPHIKRITVASILMLSGLLLMGVCTYW